MSHLLGAPRSRVSFDTQKQAMCHYAHCSGVPFRSSTHGQAQFIHDSNMGASVDGKQPTNIRIFCADIRISRLLASWYHADGVDTDDRGC